MSYAIQSAQPAEMVQAQQSLGKRAQKPPKMSLELRKFQVDDYEMYAQIWNSILPDHEVSAHELRSYDSNLDRTKYYRQRYSFFNKETGEIVGLGEIGHMPWMFNPRRFQWRIFVDKIHQNKGIGQFIYENLMRFATDLQALEAWVFAKEDMPASLGFLSNRGFKERFRTWESWLDPSTVDTSKFSVYTEKATQARVEVSSLAREKEQDPDCYRKLYELSQSLMADVPFPEPYTPISYDQWLSFDMKDPGLLPEAYAIAKDGTKYVGLSTARRLDKEPNGLWQALTGVRREYRGKGIAFAMKLKVLEWAKKNGIERIKTENATTNAPMYGINMKLGFKRQTGWIAFSKTLG